MMRDVKKIFTTRQYYTKQNKHILTHPILHPLAILEGLKTEKISHLIEDILEARISKYGNKNDYSP